VKEFLVLHEWEMYLHPGSSFAKDPPPLLLVPVSREALCLRVSSTSSTPCQQDQRLFAEQGSFSITLARVNTESSRTVQTLPPRTVLDGLLAASISRLFACKVSD